MVRNWVAVVISDVEERVKHEQEVRHQTDLFYADDGMVASSDPH